MCVCVCVYVFWCVCVRINIFFLDQEGGVEVLKLKMKTQEEGSLFQEAERQGERMGVKNFEF